MATFVPGLIVRLISYMARSNLELQYSELATDVRFGMHVVSVPVRRRHVLELDLSSTGLICMRGGEFHLLFWFYSIV